MTAIEANVSKMFADIEPWDVSNSVANLGPCAARLTWDNALLIARDVTEWLADTDIEPAAEAMRDWARSVGAWDHDEIAGWTETEALALFVQNIASELRMLGSDNIGLDECVAVYNSTDWDAASEYPTGSYSISDAAKREVHVSYYTGI